MKKGPESILIVTLSNIGDVVMTTPVIMSLVQKYPGARITAVVGPKARCVLEKSSRIHRIVVYDKKADLFSKWKFLREIWKEKYDWVVDLRNTAIPFLVSCEKRSPLFRKFTKINMRERHLEILDMMKLKAEPLSPFQFFDAKDETSCRAKLKEKGIEEKNGWILVAPGAASGRKRWPADSFKAVIQELIRKTGKKVFLAGSKDEQKVAEEVARGLPSLVKILCGETSLAETAWLISQASLVVANDSAIMHLGFEIGTPTVGLFGPTDHEKYGHEGPKFRIAKEDAVRCGCGSEKLPYAGRSCFHGLKPEKVILLCMELLKL